MPRLSHDQRVTVMTLRGEGYSVEQLRQRFNVSRSTIQRLLCRERETGRVDDRPRSGRPRVSTERDDRCLRRMSLANPRLVARNLRQRWRNEHGVTASTQTVARKLSQMGLHGRVAARKPLLSARHRRTRLQWARERLHWTAADWRQHFFTDETPIHYIQSRQRRYVRRQRGQRLRQDLIRPTVHSGSGKLMVWGGFSADGTRKLATVQGTLNTERYIQLFTDNLLPLDLTARGLTFQQDNAPPHKSRRTLQFFQTEGIQVLHWPPQSPDLNPIENLWGYLKDRLEAIEIHSMVELSDAVYREWAAIPVEVLENLIDSMPRRVHAVITAGGRHTKY